MTHPLKERIKTATLGMLACVAVLALLLAAGCPEKGANGFTGEGRSTSSEG